MSRTAPPAPRGMATFLIIWVGQVISSLGSNLSGFALGVWVYQQTGSTTRFSLIALVTTLPGILLSPVAGALVDRWDRRRAMLLGDAGAGCATLGVALLLRFGHLELWHIYLLLSISSSFSALQWPAFSAATTLLVPRQHLGRASGMTLAGDAAASILAPVLAGILVVSLGLESVLFIDFFTFVVAVAALLVVRVPRPAPTAEGAAAPRGSLLREGLSGWTFIRRRRGLLALLLLFAATRLSLGMVQVLLAPMVLSFTSADVFGRVASVAGVGMLAGSLLVSVWGGPRRRVAGILGLFLLQGVTLVIGGLRASAPLIAASAFVFLFADPLIYGCSQTLWQSKVAPDMQGRVFAVRRMVAWSSLPLAYLCAGPLADRVFEPLLAAGGPLAASLGPWIGVGKGRGIALLFMVLGVLVLLTVAAGLRNPRLRRVEWELPDALAQGDPLSSPTLTNEMTGTLGPVEVVR